MYITERIKAILSAMRNDNLIGSFIYEDKPTANVRLDRSVTDPVAILYQLSGFDIDTDGLKSSETADINVSFLRKERKIDAGAVEQETITDDMYAVAKDFVSRVFDDKTLKVTDDVIHIRYVYLNTDSNRTGCNVAMRIKEKQGHCL